MTRYLAAAKWALLAFTVTALSGCGSARDAASEEPVPVTPGFYTITTSGEVNGFAMPKGQGSGSDRRTICLMEGQQADFHRQVATSLAPHPACTHQPGERTGNAFAGAWRCPTDPQRAPGGTWSVDYTGVISAEQVEVTGQMRIDLPDNLPGLTEEDRARLADGEAMMESVDIVVTANRTGDCG